ncbi:hypothetical protein B0H10DRAFT_2106641, partial [Mycena sp. CBHHK59/15]
TFWPHLILSLMGPHGQSSIFPFDLACPQQKNHALTLLALRARTACFFFASGTRSLYLCLMALFNHLIHFFLHASVVLQCTCTLHHILTDI